jgi:hypothetical protein
MEERMEKQQKKVELGDGWTATITRPSLGTWVEWQALAYPAKPGGEGQPEKGLSDEERKLTEPEAEEQGDLSPAAYRFLEERLLPECVAGLDFEGKPKSIRVGFHYPDLGFARLAKLSVEIVRFLREADGAATFRDN